MYQVSGDCVCRGDTARAAGEDDRTHPRDVRLQKDNAINFNFGEKCHTLSDVAFTVPEKTYGTERTERQLQEGNKKLSTARPTGCNVKNIYIPAVLQ